MYGNILNIRVSIIDKHNNNDQFQCDYKTIIKLNTKDIN